MTMTGCDWCDFVLDVVEQHDMADSGHAGSCEFPTRVESPFLIAVPYKQGPAIMRCWKDDHGRSKHFSSALGFDARLWE
jgi:hypothetical protein